MAYITITDLQNVIDANNLALMTADFGQVGGNINTPSTTLSNILQLASDKADALVSSIYTVPFTTTIPVKIRTAAIVFAAEMLYARRLTPMERNPFTDEANHWRNELIKINNGDIPLDGAVRRSFTPIVHSTYKSRVNTNFF